MNPSIYTRPDKPRTMFVRKRRRSEQVIAEPLPEPLILDKATECYITPPDVAERMAYYLPCSGLNAPLRVLEPSAGTGNLCAALLERGFHTITAIERDHTLAEVLRERFSDSPGVEVTQCDFLEHESTERFERILINPPFSRVKKHMAAALDLLAPGGSMVALVPITYQHEQAETLEELARDTFPGINVSTKLILLNKHDSA